MRTFVGTYWPGPSLVTNKTKAEETVIDHRLSQEPLLLFILTHRPSFFNSVNARTPSISASKLSSEI